MDETRILIIGANGQLGTALQERFPTAQAVSSGDLDITNTEQLANCDWTSVDTIINAAAYTNVDGAESDEGRVLSWQINATGVTNLAKIATEYNLTLVHISSDYVFDGSKNPHFEDEMFSPLGVYGQSKAAGDLAVTITPRHYILRTTWMIGEGKNFVRIMLDLGKRGISPKVVSDQIGRLTFTSELVNIIDHLLEKSAPYGVYNATNNGEPDSWSNIARSIFKRANFDLSVTDVTTEEYYREKPEAAPRPLNSVMELSKLDSTGFTGHDWHNNLTTYIQKELQT